MYRGDTIVIDELMADEECEQARAERQSSRWDFLSSPTTYVAKVIAPNSCVNVDKGWKTKVQTNTYFYKKQANSRFLKSFGKLLLKAVNAPKWRKPQLSVSEDKGWCSRQAEERWLKHKQFIQYGPDGWYDGVNDKE